MSGPFIRSFIKCCVPITTPSTLYALFHLIIHLSNIEWLLYFKMLEIHQWIKQTLITSLMDLVDLTNDKLYRSCNKRYEKNKSKNNLHIEYYDHLHFIDKDSKIQWILSNNDMKMAIWMHVMRAKFKISLCNSRDWEIRTVFYCFSVSWKKSCS